MNNKVDLSLNQAANRSVFLGGVPAARGGAEKFGRVASVDTPIYENSFNLLDTETGLVSDFSIDKSGQYVSKTCESSSRQNSITNRFKLLDISSRLLWQKDKGKDQHKTCKCHKVTYLSDTDYIGLKADSFGNGHVSGLIKCGKYWTCPVCASTIAEFKAEEIRQGFNEAQALGYKIELWNFTIPHYRDQDFSSNLQAQKEALESFWRSATVKKYRKQFGMVGRISALEITFSKANGFHPHYHIVVFAKKQTGDFSRQLLQAWQNAILESGLFPRTQASKQNFHRALVIKDGRKAGEYINKFGTDGDTKLTTKNGDPLRWDIADEITKQVIKKGRNQSLTPFDILKLIASGQLENNDLSYFKSVYREYVSTVQKNKLAHIRWSRGLRSALGLGSALSDEEIINSVEHESLTLGLVTKSEFKEITSNAIKTQEPIIPNLKFLVETVYNSDSSVSALARFVYDRTSQTASFDSYYMDFINRREPLKEEKLLDRKVSNPISELDKLKKELLTLDNQLASIDKLDKRYLPFMKNRQKIARLISLFN